MTKPPPTPEYRMVDVADLVPYAENARTHTDEQVAEIAASILEFGFINPVIISGTEPLLAGHGRLLAAYRLGLVALAMACPGVKFRAVYDDRNPATRFDAGNPLNELVRRLAWSVVRADEIGTMEDL